VIPSHLIELGQRALSTVTTNVENGAPLVRCQLLASEFYEALKRELRATSDLGVTERGFVAAAAYTRPSEPKVTAMPAPCGLSLIGSSTSPAPC
jgi:hypothetical protein